MAKNQSTVTGLDEDATAPANENDAAVVAADPAESIAGVGHDAQLSGKRRTITIHQTDADGGGDAVNMGLNGYAYQIPRGIPVSIPVELFEVLKNCVTTRLVQGAGGVIKEHKAQRFSFQAE